MVAQLAVNQCVPGSSPGRGAISGISEVVITTDCLSVITGSNPVFLAKLLLRLMARTAGSGPVNEGSSPSEAANLIFIIQ